MTFFPSPLVKKGVHYPFLTCLKSDGSGTHLLKVLIPDFVAKCLRCHLDPDKALAVLVFLHYRPKMELRRQKEVPYMAPGLAVCVFLSFATIRTAQAYYKVLDSSQHVSH